MKKFNNLSINDLLPDNSRPFPKGLWFVLILSFSLNLIAINWGLPSPSSRGWAADEITPASVINGIDKKFSNGWTTRYPPLHFYVLSVFYLPFYSLRALNVINAQTLFITTLFFLIGRLMSVFMGTAIVFFVYLCGCEVMEKKPALFASLITALTPPFLYYSKTVNTDIPYVFWFIVALYFFIRILKFHQTSDYILFAATAVFSITTKDQAYGLFILTPFIIIFSFYQHNKSQVKKFLLLKSIFNKKTMSALVVGTTLFILIQNWIFNFQGFKRHLLLILGPAKGERLFPNNVSGFMSMLIQTFDQLKFILGWPILLICMVGLIYALTKKKKYPYIFWLLVPLVTYYVTFMFTIGRNPVRHLIPVYILMSFFGALCVSYFLHASRRFKIIKSLLVFILFANAALYSFSVDVIMINDSRYYVEQWMQKNIEKDESILFVGYINFLPRNKGYTHVKYLHRPSQNDIKKINPSYILINSDLLNSAQPYLYQKITKDGLGYKQILKYKSSPWLNLLPEHKIKRNHNGQIITNLSLINPEIIIFKKQRENADDFS